MQQPPDPSSPNPSRAAMQQPPDPSSPNLIRRIGIALDPNPESVYSVVEWCIENYVRPEDVVIVLFSSSDIRSDPSFIQFMQCGKSAEEQMAGHMIEEYMNRVTDPLDKVGIEFQYYIYGNENFSQSSQLGLNALVVGGPKRNFDDAFLRIRDFFASESSCEVISLDGVLGSVDGVNDPHDPRDMRRRTKSVEVLGRRKALLVGCEYPNDPKNHLDGIDVDLQRMFNLVSTEKGFTEITILFDGPKSNEAFQQHIPLTNGYSSGGSIKEQFKNLLDGAVAGDELLFYFSGHGTQFRYENGEREELLVHERGKEEWEGEEIVYSAIVPADFNLIAAEDFRKRLARLPIEATITFIFDCCYSGGILKDEELEVREKCNDKKKGLKCLPIERVMSHFANKESWDFEAIRDELIKQFREGVSIVFLGLRKIGGDVPYLISIRKAIYLSACRKTELSYSSTVGSDFTIHLVQVAHDQPSGSNLSVFVHTSWKMYIEEYKNTTDQAIHPVIFCSRSKSRRLFLGWEHCVGGVAQIGGTLNAASSATKLDDEDNDNLAPLVDTNKAASSAMELDD